ncbi:MAG: hypothetical protein K2Q06_12035, partial [Parvularculaceae bacterium]|nr:hypothetical protein [Parvularculaceae bacterium]
AVADDAAKKEEAQPGARAWSLAGIAAALLAALGLFRWKRIRAAVAPALRRATDAVGTAAKAAAQTTIAVLGKPARVAILAVGIALFGIASVDWLDWEWAAGLAVGAVGATLAFISLRRLQRFASHMVGGS